MQEPNKSTYSVLAPISGIGFSTSKYITYIKMAFIGDEIDVVTNNLNQMSYLTCFCKNEYLHSVFESLNYVTHFVFDCIQQVDMQFCCGNKNQISRLNCFFIHIFMVIDDSRPPLC